MVRLSYEEYSKLYTVHKTSLRSIIKYDNNTKIINDAVINVNKIVIHIYNFLKIYYLHNYIKNNTVIDINLSLLRNISKVLCNKESRGRKLSQQNQKLYDEITKKASPYYTIQQFHPFLVNTVNDYTNKEITDYLSAYIKTIENTMSENIPIIEEPNIYPVPKGTIRNSSIVFVILLMATTFAAFLLEAVKEGRVRA